MDRLRLPESLRGVFFDQIWDKAKVWALPTRPSLLPLQHLVWHLDLPVWTTVPGEARFDLAPRTVLAQPNAFPRDWQRIMMVDTVYPLEMFRSGGRWVVLDGYHRLARCFLERNEHVPVRLHPDECWREIGADVEVGARYVAGSIEQGVNDRTQMRSTCRSVPTMNMCVPTSTKPYLR